MAYNGTMVRFTKLNVDLIKEKEALTPNISIKCSSLNSIIGINVKDSRPFSRSLVSFDWWSVDTRIIHMRHAKTEIFFQIPGEASLPTSNA
mmetsp:Transcript_36175/g.77142  ORF Transcript_36175/g.77142 Transcript_36175/m.77142 type:complete len:91 (+) Transcript_36175:1130-1402(+)